MKLSRCNQLIALTFLIAAGALNPFCAARAADYEPKPTNSYFLKFNPRKAPAPGPLLLQPGDQLAIIGDSITEQKKYSRIIETYLAACVPELKLSVRQFGWGGETAEGFLRRMTNDCLLFKPTVATLNFGMNDHHYRPFDPENALWYQVNYSAVVQNLENIGARVVVGSPGCVGKVPGWNHPDIFTRDELNINLCAFRDIDIQIARNFNARFADVFWTMFKAGYEGETRYGTTNGSYVISGKDGVHPGWAGHLVMAYTYLRALGLDGDLGTLTVDLDASTATGTAGHNVESFKDHTLTVTSSRYPFCAGGEVNNDDSIRSGTTLVPFFEELSRFRLVLKNAHAPKYQITWGSTTKTFTAEELSAGVNLAAEFVDNPFCAPFNKVDEAVAAKQAYETKQIKQSFHSKEAKADIAKVFEATEAERAPLAAAITAAMLPVRYTIVIQPAP